MRKMNNLLKYALVGGCCATLDIALFYFLYDLFHLNLFVSISIAFLLATIINYVASIIFIFDSCIRFERRITEFLVILIVSVTGLVFNWSIIYALISIFNLNIILSKIVAVLFVFGWNYTSRQFYVFNKLDKNSLHKV